MIEEAMNSIEPYFRFSFLIDICLVLILFIRFTNVNINRLIGIKTIDSVKMEYRIIVLIESIKIS